ncbi:guanylyl cyclase [Roseobacter cerasinus]|uniref:Guanylyl cyclase n=1 Tax=Roseobacter cerasinus TaxID=2602289 RepID=A0A640VN87_9RHOB|nr:tetratricopeptide repeat protein [Roseobacter cerasinus]GFE49713.1 guanylyl cyclase [Roseobacter cerasinus]
MEPSQVTHYGLTTVLVADIYGFSRLMSRDEEETSIRVSRAIDLIRQLAIDYGGTIKNIAGDGVLALFDSVSNSVQFAVAMQQEFLNDAVWNSGSDPLSFRIGINMGEVREGHFGMHGHAINVAARLQGLAKPGGICVSEVVSRVARDQLQLPLKSLGTPVLKNIDDQIEVFEIEPKALSIRAPAEAPTIIERVTTLQDLPDNSVAVLPLENLSGQPQNAHLCNGVTGDIISNLTRFKALHVIAQQSSNLFAGRHMPISDIGRLLGVRYLATGGFQRSNNQLRVQIQLLEAESGRSVWGETFSGNIEDIFTFQDEITAIIASCLSVKIDKAERQRQQRKAPSDLQAYGLILRGRDVYAQPRRELNLHARRLFEQASAIDPDYAASYTSISRTSNDAWRFNWVDHPDGALDDAISNAEMALRLDPDDARGHAALGNACLYKRRHDESLAAYERAIQFNPNDADILAEMGHSAGVYGEPERAVELIKRAMQLNPFYPDWYLWHLGEAYFDMSDYEEAIRTLTQMRDKTDAYRMLTASNALLGRMDVAKRHAAQILKTHPEFTLTHWENVPPDRNPGPRDRLIEGLKKAGLE